MSLPTVDDLKPYLNKTSNADDAELTDMLDAAVDIAEGVVGPLTSETVTETHYGLSSAVLVLRRAPALALTSVSGRVYPGALQTSYLLTDYTLDPDTGIVRLANGYRFAGDYTVTYSAGRTTLPAAVRLAILIIAGHLWETQRGVAPTPLQQQDAFGPPPTAGYALPNRAQELLAPYARGPRVA